MKGILLIIVVFLRENTISFHCFSNFITDVRSHIGLVLAFLDLDFFSFVDFFRSRIFFCLRFLFFFFIFFSRARDDDEVVYLVYVVRNDEVG
jgi:hypothetical protein